MVSEPLKILTLGTEDIEGGAARAAFRLHQGLRDAGSDARMLVRRKLSDMPWVWARGAPSRWAKVWGALEPWVDLWPLALYPRRVRGPWSSQWLPALGRSITLPGFMPDIIHSHWVGGGFLPLAALGRYRGPVVWTLHDMWAFTGGCHYDAGCGRYQSGCGECPQLGSRAAFDLSRWTWRRKAQHWRNLNLTLVCPSRWLAACAARSALFRETRIEVIPNGLDIAQFQPLDKTFSKRLFGFPEAKRLILFGAMAATQDPKKGYAHLGPALRQFAQSATARDCELVIFGASRPENPPDFGLPCHYVGRLHDEVALAALYSAADVMLAPSIQDNLPNTVMEALACGTPVVAFDIGGMPDLIAHRGHGFLARPFSTEDFAAGMTWVLEDAGRWRELSTRAREKVVAEYALPKIAQRHLRLYSELLP